MKHFEIVHAVFDAFKGLPEKLAEINSHSAELYRSHGRQPKTENPEANGNVSPVTHFMRYVAQFEAVEPGSGQMLANRVHAELTSRFRDKDELDPHSLHGNFIDETHDVSICLARTDFENMKSSELRQVEVECDEACESAMDIKSHVRALLRKREVVSRRTVTENAKNRLEVH